MKKGPAEEMSVRLHQHCEVRSDPGPPVMEAPVPTKEADRTRSVCEYLKKRASAHESLQQVMARHRETLEATQAVMDAFWLGLQYSHSMDDDELAEFMASLTQSGHLCGKVERTIADQHALSNAL